MTPIRTILIDADPVSVDQISTLIGNHAAFELVAVVSTGHDALQALHAHAPDLVLLDLHLPDMPGFELLHKVSPALQPFYIFLASTADHAIKAFEYYAFDYLLRPFSDERLQLTLIKVREEILQHRSRHLDEKINALFRYMKPATAENEKHSNGKSKLLPVKLSGRIYFIHPDDIEYIEAAGYYIEVFANGKKHLLRQSLTQLDEFLDSHKFLRIHRSVMINVHFLKEIIRDGANDFSVRMANDALFKISRSYKTEVFDKIGI